MNFVVDECTGPTVAAWLSQQGHDAVSIYDQARGEEDEQVLQRAYAEERILVTSDEDFGELIFREKRPHHGVACCGWQIKARPRTSRRSMACLPPT